MVFKLKHILNLKKVKLLLHLVSQLFYKLKTIQILRIGNGKQKLLSKVQVRKKIFILILLLIEVEP